MAEQNVNRLWNAWSTKFKNKTSMEVLAMVAFRFAELFFTQNAMVKDAERSLTEFEAKLDGILHEMVDGE